MISVLTFNTASFNDKPLWRCEHYDEHGMQPLFDFTEQHLQHLLKVILTDCQPDVLCLQESVLLPPSPTGRGHLRRSSFGSSDDGDDDGDQVEKDGKKGPPAFSLDNAATEDGEEESGGAVGGAASARQRAVAELLKAGYKFIGKTSTHADETALYVRERSTSEMQIEILPPSLGGCSCVGGEQGGSNYNFPLALLRVTRLKPSSPSSSSSFIIAVTSVHLTPFSSGGRSRKHGGCSETRRDTQLRRTLAGLYVALEKYFLSVPKSEQSRINCAILVAGDFNIKQGERSCAEILSVDDVHDILRDEIAPSDAWDAFVLPESRWSEPPLRREATNDAVEAWSQSQTSRSEMWTWDSFRNRFNGAGAQFSARFDRVLYRAFANATPASLRLESARCIAQSNPSWIESGSNEDDEHEQEEDELPSIVASNCLRPVSLRLVGHKPVRDANLDLIDAAAYARHLKIVAEQRQDDEEGGRGLQMQSLLADDGKERMSLNIEDLELGEHAGPLPPGGRERFLSDHFGLFAQFVII